MGNAESLLRPYRYEFDNPKIGDLDLSPVKVYVINDTTSAEAAEEFLSDARILYVDCEGHCFGAWDQKLGTVQVATGPDCCLVFHIAKYRKSLDFLKMLFESNKVQKVFHDCSGDSAVLFHENEIRLTYESVDDTQIAHKVIKSIQYGTSIDRTTGRSLADLYKIYCGKNIPGNKRINKNFPGENMWVHSSELLPKMIKYAVVDALAIFEVFTKQERMLKRTQQYKELIKKQLNKKIRFHEEIRQYSPQQEKPGLSNWGLFGAGVATVAVVGAAVALHNESKKAQCSEKKKKEKECTIS